MAQTVSAGGAAGSARRRPGQAELRRRYTVDGASLSVLARSYGAGNPVVRGWLVDAGVQIRCRGDGGYRRQLSPPSGDRLAAMVQAGSTVPQLAALLKVSPATVRRWLGEAGIAAPAASLRDRPRGALTPVARPPAEDLRGLYVEEQLSLQSIAERLGVGVHLVRVWLRDAGIELRPAGGRPGQTHTARPVKAIPPAKELHALRVQQRWALPAIARRYGVHPSTVARWCRHHGLPARVPPVDGAYDDAALIALYRDEGLSGAEIARRTGASAKRVLAVLHRAGIDIDPRRHADAVAAASRARTGTVASLSLVDAEFAVARHGQGWSYRRIADRSVCPLRGCGANWTAGRCRPGGGR